MELSSTNIKKILIFSQKKAFPIFSQVKPCIFHPKLKKQKKSTLEKFLILQESKTSKKFLVLSKKKAFLIFWETETLEWKLSKSFIYFRR